MNIAAITDPDSDVGILIRNLYAAASVMEGVTLSEWQANIGKYRVRNTWILHRGERAMRSGFQEDVLYQAVLRQRVGTTQRCEAWRKLSPMLEAALQYMRMGERERYEEIIAALDVERRLQS